MIQPIELPAGKALVFHFTGGPDHGRSLRFDKPHSPQGTGYALWKMTGMGSVGHQFEWFAEGATHRYIVTDRRETSDTIIVVCEHAED